MAGHPGQSLVPKLIRGEDPQGTTRGPAMPLEQVLKAIEKHDGEEFARHLTADCEFRAPGFEATGPAQTWPWMTAFLDAFPDIDHRVVTSVASGDREAAEVVISGTHTQALVSAQGT